MAKKQTKRKKASTAPRRPKKTTGRKKAAAKRQPKHTHKTKSGQLITLHHSIADKFRARKAENAKRKATRLAGMPKSRVKRFFYRLHPKRLYKYWFSREGAIMFLRVTGIGIIVGFLVLVGLFAYFRKDLPDLRDISGNNIGGSIRYYDRTGEELLWEDFDAVKRVPVPGDQISEHMKDAAIAVEDRDFFNHSGFDVRGISRAAWRNVTGHGEVRQGGSTITQQLVRLTQAEVGAEQTYTRKLKELILSIELERSFTKEEILIGYLNTAPFGNVQYGVESASQDYFDKPASELDIAESAFMAAIPQSPSFYSPYGANFNPEAIVGRTQFVLEQMRNLDMISDEEYEEAIEVDILAKVQEPRTRYQNISAPWFVLTAKEQLETTFTQGAFQGGGWKVTTTLDMELQETAEQSVQDGLEQVRRQGGDSAGFVAEDVETGQVVALVGGADFDNEEYGQNNYATLRLPPGSSIKPYNYLALMEYSEDFGAGSVLYDEQGPLPGYPCTTGSGRDGNCLRNFDFRYPGPVTLRYALGGSRNVPAVKAMLIAGIDNTIELAERLMANPDDPDEIVHDNYNCYADEALTVRADCFTSAGIGDGAFLRLDRHVHGMATISRNGNNIPQTYILKVQDSEGRVIDEWEPTPGEQVVREDSAYIVSDMMADPDASYMSTKPHRYQGWDFSLKTGTTNDAKDGWIVGFSTKYSAGVWVGSHNRQVEMTGFMETMTRPIWQDFMFSAHDGLDPIPRERPSGIQELPAFVMRNNIGLAAVVPSRSTDIYPSWFERTGGTNEEQEIDIVSNKLATECTPERARRTVTGGDPSLFSGDTFVENGADTTQEDDVHDCDDTMPSVSLSYDESGNSYTINWSASAGTHPLSSDDFPGVIEFRVNGSMVEEISVSNSNNSGSFSYDADFSGTRTMTATIVDSVLYEGEDSITLSGLSGNDSSTDFDLSYSTDNDDYIFSWSGASGGGTVTVQLQGSGQTVCTGTGSSGECTSEIQLSSGDIVYATRNSRTSNEVEID
jgi:membrane peptidoglycan carboxypeptidase